MNSINARVILVGGCCNLVVKVIHIDTKDQEADYLTKGLPLDAFLRLRKKVQGW